MHPIRLQTIDMAPPQLHVSLMPPLMAADAARKARPAIRACQEHTTEQASFDTLQVTSIAPDDEADFTTDRPNLELAAAPRARAGVPTRSTDGQASEYLDKLVPQSGVVIHVGDVLGSGAGGIVYRASFRHRSDSRPDFAAVKMLHKDDHKRTQCAMADLRSEMRIASEIPVHPNLPKFWGSFYATPQNPCIIWELIDGQNLQDLFALKRKTDQSWHPTAQECLSWCQQLFAALACLHESNLVHRDVKPANIMVTDDHSTIKLVDYGLCRRLDAPTSAKPRNLSGIAGSFRYMAPEVLLDPAGYGAEVDIYSGAMVCYFIAAGMPPFSNLHGEQVAELAARTYLRPTPCKHLQNPDFWRILETAWASDPALRPDACCLGAQLGALLQDHERTRPKSPLTRLSGLYRSVKRGLKRHNVGRVQSRNDSPRSDTGCNDSPRSTVTTSLTKMSASPSSTRSSSPLPSSAARIHRCQSR